MASLSGTPESRYRVFDFSGGLNTTDRPQALKENEVSGVQNMVFSERGSAKKRDGINFIENYFKNNKIDGVVLSVLHTYEEKQKSGDLTKSFSAVDGENYLYGVYALVDANGNQTDSRFFRYAKFTDGTDSFTSYVFDNGSGQPYIITERPHMFFFAEIVYVLANKQLWKFDNPNFTLCPNAIPFTSGTLYHNRMFYIGKTNEKDIVYFSQLGAPDTLDMTISNDSGAASSTAAGGVVAVRSDRGDTPITGLAVFLNNLIIFKEDNIFSLSGYTPDQDYQLTQLNVTTGAINQNVIAQANNDIYYLGKDGNVYALTTPYQGYIATKVISQTITSEIYDLMNDPNYPFELFSLQYFRNKLYLIAGDTCFMYDERLTAWTKLKFPFSVSFTYVDPMSQELVFFTNYLFSGGNYAYHFVSGQLYDVIDPTTNEKLGIDANLKTAYYYFKEPEVTKRFKYAKVFYKPHEQNFAENEPDHRNSQFDVNLEVNYSGVVKEVDSDHTTFTWGVSNWGDYLGDPLDSTTAMVRFGGSGESLRVTFSNSNVYEPLEIHGFVVGYKTKKRVR